MNNLIDRYTYQVGKFLPSNLRKEVVLELNSILYDMVDENASEEDIVKMLKAYGHPKEVALKYSTQNQYLIGPQIYPMYKLVLSIVIGIGLLVVFVTTAVSAVFESASPLATLFIGLGNLFNMAAVSFAIVTGTFALLQRTVPESDLNVIDSLWEPEELPGIVSPKAEINMLKIGINLLFSALLLVLVLLYPSKVGIYIFNENSTRIIPLLNMDVFSTYVPFIALLISFHIIHTVLLVKKGYWSNSMRITKIAIEIINAILLIVLFSDKSLVSAELFANISKLPIEQLNIVNMSGKITFVVFIVIIIVATLSEIRMHIKNMTK